MADPQQANGAGGLGSGSAVAAAADMCRTVLVIDGAYAHIGARHLEGNRIDYIKLRSVLETLAGSRLRECWFFDQEPILQRSSHQSMSAQYTALKLAPPHGPQFQLKLYAMKKYQCNCRRCGHQFSQMVQKGVDNGIATKILSLAYENICDRFILFAGDGDFYDSLNQIKNVLRKDLWVIGYRNTVSADLQQLASHVIWINDLWSDIKMLTTASGKVAAAARNESDAEEDGEVSEHEHEAPPRPRKRGKERQVQVTSQKPPAAGDKQRRDRSRSRTRGGGGVQQPAEKDAGSSNHTAHAPTTKAAGASASAPVQPRRTIYGPQDDARAGDARPTRAERRVLRVKRRRNDVPPPAAAAAAGALKANEQESSDAVSRRIPTAPMTFAMSDISSSDDDDKKYVPPETKLKELITVIDLASDSDTSSD